MSFLSSRGQRLGSRGHRQTASTADVSVDAGTADTRRSRSTNPGFRGIQRFEARRTMDESQLVFQRAHAKHLNPPIDYRALEYVTKYDDNLVCPICRCPFVDPVILTECDHCFCRDCIRQTWESHPLGPRGDCPTCRTPAKLGPRSATSKIIVNILDDMEVQCPKHVHGCEAVVKRGEVQDHVTLYCGYGLVECPSNDCTQPIVRKGAAQGCLHLPASCGKCRQTMLVSDLDQHWFQECPDTETTCQRCNGSVPYRKLDEHNRDSCPAINVACPGHEYGCEVRLRRMQIDAHSKDCVLAKLGPLFTAQKHRMDEHETAQRQMRRKLEILERGLVNMQRLLNPQLDGPDGFSADESRIPFLPEHRREGSFATAHTAMDNTSVLDFDEPSPRQRAASYASLPPNMNDRGFAPDATPFSTPLAHGPYASPIHHLLSMHESLQDEVTRIHTALSELDGRQSMQILNEGLRNRDEIAYLGGQIAGMSRQLHWLTSAQLQREQGRGNGDLGDSASAGVGVEAAVNAVASAASALRGAARMVGTASPNTNIASAEGGRMRRGTSEEGRTKL